MASIEALTLMIEQFFDNPCPACGYPIKEDAEKRTTIKLAEIILDRTGIPAKVVTEVVNQSDGDLDLRVLTTDEKSELLGLLGQVRTLKEKVRERVRDASLSSSVH